MADAHRLGIFLFFLSLLAGMAYGQIDPDPDGIGVYFDQAATLTSTEAEAGQTVQAYLIGTLLSQTGNIGFWHARLCPWGGGANIFGSPYGSYNYDMNMPGDSCWSCVAMAMDPALPGQDITLLAELHIEIWDDLEPIGIHILAGAFYSTYDAGEGVEFTFYPSSGSEDLPVAIINGPAPVPVPTVSLDTIKALYR